MNISGMLSPDEFWSRETNNEETVRRSFRKAPVYELVGWTGPRMISEWAFGEGTRSLQFGDPAPSSSGSDRALISSQVSNPQWQLAFAYARASRPQESFETWMHSAQARDLPRPEHAALTIDGESTPCDVWTVEKAGIWWSMPRLRDTGILIEATGLDVLQVAIQQAVDIEPYIAGRRGMLRSIRGD